MMLDAYPSACCFHINLLDVYGSKQQGSAFVGANGMLASADGATPAVARATACAEEATRMDYSPTGAAYGPSHRAALVASQEAAVAATEMAAESRVREEKKQKTVVDPVEVARAAIEACNRQIGKSGKPSWLDIEPVPDDAAAAAEEDGKVKRQPGMYCTVCTDYCVDTHGSARSGTWVSKPSLSKQPKNAWDRHDGTYQKDPSVKNTHQNAVAAKVCGAWPCP